MRGRRARRALLGHHRGPGRRARRRATARASERQIVARHRKGATVGEVGAILGEPHARDASSRASRRARWSSTPTSLCELVRALPADPGATRCARRTGASPTRARAAPSASAARRWRWWPGRRWRGAGARCWPAARAASPRSVIGARPPALVRGRADRRRRAASSRTRPCCSPASSTRRPSRALLREADRVVALAGSAEDARALGALGARRTRIGAGGGR